MRKKHIGTEEHEYRGIGVSPGIAIGPAQIFARQDQSIDDYRISADQIDDELKRFEGAIRRSEKDLRKIAGVAQEKLGKESAEIFEAQLMMLRDEEVYPAVVRCINRDLCNAAFAVHETLEAYRKRLAASESDYFRERATDLADISDRIVRHLNRGEFFSHIDRETIVFSESLSAADIVLFSRRGIMGCATDFGGATSHVSIMARALGVPAVVSTHGITDVVEDGQLVVLDGFRGVVVVNPGTETLEKYRIRQERYDHVVEEQKTLVDLPAETLDNVRVRLLANLEFKAELPLVFEHGAEGVGLFRTEILFLMEGRLSISEDEQFLEYKKIVETLQDRVTTFRVLDLGGDKMLPVAHREHNPFLGWRGVRILLDKPEILRPQLRALVRASAFGPMRILIPMVTSLSEFQRFRAELDGVMRELSAEGVAFDRNVPLGVMVEVPAVALMADEYAAEVDFMSLGTNDLTQYTLAVDRGNDLVASIYQELHPAVLRLIKSTIDAGLRHNVPVGLCGEMGSNSSFVPILVGLGLREISASPVFVPEVKRLIRAITMADAEELASRALVAHDGHEVLMLLEQWLRSHPFDIIHSLGDELMSLANNHGLDGMKSSA
ncbi:MAG: phosphoenolpyruvate--protein phosphotransferase [Rhodothermales bacterium]|nr:phosphoenolpyruvate--protein phosphotransferase [Rhodothermales bacterium]